VQHARRRKRAPDIFIFSADHEPTAIYQRPPGPPPAQRRLDGALTSSQSHGQRRTHPDDDSETLSAEPDRSTQLNEADTRPRPAQDPDAEDPPPRRPPDSHALPPPPPRRHTVRPPKGTRPRLPRRPASRTRLATDRKQLENPARTPPPSTPQLEPDRATLDTSPYEYARQREPRR